MKNGTVPFKTGRLVTLYITTWPQGAWIHFSPRQIFLHAYHISISICFKSAVKLAIHLVKNTCNLQLDNFTYHLFYYSRNGTYYFRSHKQLDVRCRHYPKILLFYIKTSCKPLPQVITDHLNIIIKKMRIKRFITMGPQ